MHECPVCEGKGFTTKSRLALYINKIVIESIKKFKEKSNIGDKSD